jgi:hypothetical protein
MALRNVYQLNNQGGTGTRVVLGVRFAPLITSDLVSGRSVGLYLIPAGFVITGQTTTISDIDAGLAHQFTIGTASNNSFFVGAQSLGQAGGTVSTIATAARFFRTTEPLEINLYTTASAASPLAGTITHLIEGYFE